VDHKPNLDGEKERIEKNGGKVVWDGHANFRVYVRGGNHPGLNMSRCLGDLNGHSSCGLSSEPDVSVIDITSEDKILFLCSDGVWEFISPQEAVDLIKGHPPNMAMEAAEALAKEAWRRWIKEEEGTVVDDITVILVHLQEDDDPCPSE